MGSAASVDAALSAAEGVQDDVVGRKDLGQSQALGLRCCVHFGVG
jgi:hypothetical protein